MTEPPAEPSSGSDETDNSGPIDGSVEETTARWVKVFGIIALAFVLIVVIVHLSGGGFQGHGSQ